MKMNVCIEYTVNTIPHKDRSHVVTKTVDVRVSCNSAWEAQELCAKINHREVAPCELYTMDDLMQHLKETGQIGPMDILYCHDTDSGSTHAYAFPIHPNIMHDYAFDVPVNFIQV